MNLKWMFLFAAGIMVSQYSYSQGFIWSQTTNLPELRSHFFSFAHNDRVYIVGGVNNQPNVNGTVYYAPILADKSLGSWISAPPITDDLYIFGGGFEPDSGWIYVAGGRTHGGPLADVLYSRVRLDGTLEPWQTTASLPQGLNTQGSTLYKGFFYQLGGAINFANNPSDQVYFSKLNSDGTLQPWQSTTPLPIALVSSFCFGFNDKIYVTGGYTDIGGAVTSDGVYYAQMNANGTLGTWIPTENLPFGLAHHRGFLRDDMLYIAGGLNGTFGFQDIVYGARINNDGSVSPWTFVGTIPVPVQLHEMPFTSDAVYLLGGENAAGYQNGAYWADSLVDEVKSVNSEFPNQFALKQNYPNPFNPTTTIEFSLPRSGHARLQVFNILGEIVATLVNEELNVGTYTTQWDANGVTSGVYFYQLRAGTFVNTKKLLLLK